MKVHEILNEAISLIGERDIATKIIMDTITEVMGEVYRYLLDDIRFINNYSRLADTAENYWQDLDSRIAKQLMSRYTKPPFNVWNIRFVHMSSRGTTTGHIINLDEQFVNRLMDSLYQNMKSSVSNEIFNNDGSFNKEALYKQCNKYKTAANIQINVNAMVATLIHELVHVIQLERQKNRTSQGHAAEYRSYLTKDNNRFYKAVNNMTSMYDHKLYYASPQEIGAFAHNMAIDLINEVMYEMNITKLSSKQEIGTFILGIKDLLKNYTEVIHQGQYKQHFADPKNPTHYKIFKRFMKKVYQELETYKQYLTKQIS